MGALKLSVVLPAHRADDFLLAALRSVEEALSNLDAELIVIANGQDASAVENFVVKNQARSSTRIIKSGIPSLIYSLNRGLEAATGEYLARFDSDDICLPNRFKHQLHIAAETGADFIFGSAEIIRSDSIPTGQVINSTTNLWRICGPIHPTAMMRRSVLLSLGGYGNLEFSEDYHLWLRAASRGYKIIADPATVIYYRIHQDQVTDKRKLVYTFAANAGIKITSGLRERSILLFLGAVIDMAKWVYRSFLSAFD